MKQAPEQVLHEDSLLAIIIRSDYKNEGIEFFTPDDFSQQLAYMNRPAGYKIAPHVHNKIEQGTGTFDNNSGNYEWPVLNI